MDLMKANIEYQKQDQKLALMTEWIRTYMRLMAKAWDGRRYFMMKSDLDTEANMKNKWENGPYHVAFLEVLKQNNSSSTKWELISTTPKGRNTTFHQDITKSNVREYARRDGLELKKLGLPEEEENVFAEAIEFVVKSLIAE